MKRLRYANEVLNGLDEEQIRSFQERRLLRQIGYCYNNSEFYRRRFKDVGVDPRDILTLDDYQAMPVLMDKEQERLAQAESLERDGHPFGAHLCCAPEDLAITATTSGTTGKPTFTYSLAREDLYLLGPAFALMMGHAGLAWGDRVLFSYALGVYATSVALPPLRAAGILPIDVDVRGGADAVLRFAEMTRPLGAMMTPSLAQHLIDRIPDTLGHPPSDLNLHAMFLIGEIGVGVPSIKAKLESAYGCRIYDWIAPVGQTLAFSCDSDDYHGMHAVTPDTDLYPMDLVDPETKEHVDITDGVEGEAIYTSLGRKALPMLRYASGDIVKVLTDPCPGCGFTGARLKVVGRSDDLLIVKGANVYPGAIKQIINKFVPAVTGEMRIVLDKPPPSVEPPLRMKIEFGEDTSTDDLPDVETRIRTELHNRLRVSPEIQWLAPRSLDRALGKTPLFEKRYDT